jgi:biotin-dependent carboxylase-like uncharacterized protein
MTGALDRLSLEVGNRLAGNPPQAAGLEITFGPTVLRFAHDTRIALAGADLGAALDAQPVYAWWSLPVQAGQALTLRAARHGMRGYVCVAGGIDVPPMLGSRSTDLGAHFGGLGGRALCDGDSLPVGAPLASARWGFSMEAGKFGVEAPLWWRFAGADEPARRRRPKAGHASATIRVMPGPEYDSFTPDAQQAFWLDEWQVTPNSNRMGYRLAGNALKRTQNVDLLSHAVLPGTIQVPPDGQPIVLMSDAQTTGGYPKIGSVIDADLWKLAQVRLNATVRFVPSTPDQARMAIHEERAYLRQIDLAIEIHEDRDAERRARQPSAPAASWRKPCESI